jgi:cytochrome c oxidase subunit II
VARGHTVRTARRRTARLVRVILGGGLLVAVLTGCTRADLEDKLRFGWPRGITDHAAQMRVLWTWSTIAALAVGVIVWGLMFWCAIVYRRRGDVLPKQTKYNLPIELVYTVIPFVIIAVLFGYTYFTENKVITLTATPDTTVHVVAFKWNWEFQYADQRDPTTNDFVYTVGSSDEIPVLVIPEGKKVRFTETSNDVVHSFWVPEFLFKRDVFPSPENQFEITPTKTGSYVGRCAELCGTYHSQMNFEVRVVSNDDYHRYLQALARIGNADPDRQSKALEAIGQPGFATTTYPFNTSRVDRAPSERGSQGGTS